MAEDSKHIGPDEKLVYKFGAGQADGTEEMRNELGGKGASMAGMTRLNLPVPPGFTIPTKVCNYYFEIGGLPDEMKEQALEALHWVEEIMDAKFGDPDNPLLVSARSGARQSMPGMMDTVLNVGLTTETIPGLIKQTGNPRFVYDTYRRLITMYADVVMEMAEGIVPEEGQGIRVQLERLMRKRRIEKRYIDDTDFTAEDLKELCEDFKVRIKEVLGREFPDDPYEQLWGAIAAVFKSWNNPRSVSYRRIEGIPDHWGTACTVQSMVYGNMGPDSATGVAFTRNPATGENEFYGEILFNAQGEDVVAGIRTPNPLNEESKNEQNRELESLESKMPEIYEELCEIRRTLERHSRDMVDLEFTIQEGKLYIVQYRVGKRTATAALNMAMDMVKENLIDEETMVLRLKPEQLGQLLYPVIDPDAEEQVEPIAKGLPAGPGGASGHIVFTSDDAVEWADRGKDVILVREETSPEDVEGMRASVATLTVRGGMTSHAALVTRGWGKCCIVGAAALEIDAIDKQLTVEGEVYKEGDVLTLNGTKGLVYEGELPMRDSTSNPRLLEFMDAVDEYRILGVRANADTPEDAQQALEFGAEGIGLLRTEHMFYGEGSDEPLLLLRKMILSDTKEKRIEALEELKPYVKDSIKATLAVMEDKPVTIRLLDPPLHEFVPQSKIGQEKLANALGIDVTDVRRRADELRENNPMMGHRGVRLGITYPEIPEMQVSAIIEAVAELKKEGKDVSLEIMIPVIAGYSELRTMNGIVEKQYKKVIEELGIDLDVALGTMIEIPRACMRGRDMAKVAEFFSFGTNDLTQMGFGFS
ncbi:MAG: pyruvate, phosphate dikinase, partial [Candidatus Thorarchaeota archaeon]